MSSGRARIYLVPTYRVGEAEKIATETPAERTARLATAFDYLVG